MENQERGKLWVDVCDILLEQMRASALKGKTVEVADLGQGLDSVARMMEAISAQQDK